MCSKKTLFTKIHTKQIYPMGCSLPIPDLEHLHLMSLFSFISMADIKPTGSYMFSLHCICSIFLFFPLFLCLLLDWVFLLLHLISSSDSLFVRFFNILKNYSDVCNHIFNHIYFQKYYTVLQVLYGSFDNMLLTPPPYILWFYCCIFYPYVRHEPTTDCYYSFSSNHVWMWELDHKEGRVPKNWCFWTVVLEKTLGNLLDWRDIKPVNPKGNQAWIITGRTDAEGLMI